MFRQTKNLVMTQSQYLFLQVSRLGHKPEDTGQAVHNRLLMRRICFAASGYIALGKVRDDE